MQKQHQKEKKQETHKISENQNKPRNSIKEKRRSYPAMEVRRKEVMTHQPVTVEAVTVAKSKKYTRLNRETRVPTRKDKNKPSVR